MTGVRSSQRLDARAPLGSWVCALAITAAILLQAPLPSYADVRITGAFDKVRIEAADARISDILNGLEKAFALNYRSATTLNRSVTGVFEGSLRQVIRRLLGDYDFIIKNSPGETELTVLGVRGAKAVAASLDRSASGGEPPGVPTHTATPQLPTPFYRQVSQPRGGDELPSVMGSLHRAARTQLSRYPMPSPTTLPYTPPAAPEIAALTRRAGTELQLLRRALAALPR